MTATREIEALGGEIARLVPHRFELIAALGDGTPIPAEALSEDHTIGIYRDVIPRKMRENIEGFREVEVADFVPQAPAGESAPLFLEYPGLRGVRFRAERLQYLTDGWWATTPEVKYPAQTVLAILHVMKQRYGAVRMYLNTEIPMPLWMRSAPLGRDAAGAQAVVQARGEDRILFTNIHSECTMEFAAQFAEAARSYYRLA